MTNANTNTKKSAISAEIDSGVLTLTFGAGGSIVIDPKNLEKPIIEMAILHGLKQKLVDAAAIARNTITGESASLTDKKEAVMAVYDRLMRGEWNATRSTGEGTAKGSLLLLALQRLQPQKSGEELATWLDGLTNEQKTALSKNAKILPIIQTIQAERAAKAAEKLGVDSDGLLNDLLGE